MNEHGYKTIKDALSKEWHSSLSDGNKAMRFRLPELKLLDNGRAIVWGVEGELEEVLPAMMNAMRELKVDHDEGMAEERAARSA